MEKVAWVLVIGSVVGVYGIDENIALLHLES